MNERQVTLRRQGLSMLVTETRTTEYLKDVSFYAGDVAEGTYRIVRNPKGRFQFRALQRDYWYGPVYKVLLDHKTRRAVTKPAGGGWCALGVKKYRLDRHVRFDLVPV